MPEDAKGTALAERRQAEVELAWQILEGTAEVPEQDAESAQAAIRNRIRESEDMDSVFGEQELEAWQDYIGEVFTVHGFHLNRSSFEEGSPVYAVVTVSRQGSDEKTLLTTGGSNVLAQLVKALERDWFPLNLVMVEKATSTAGRKTYWLRKIES